MTSEPETKRPSRIPTFQTYQEEAEFWDTHDTTDFEDEFRPVTVRVAEDLWAGYDPERLRATVREVAGTLTPEEGERLKESIRRGREEGTRPHDRR